MSDFKAVKRNAIDTHVETFENIKVTAEHNAKKAEYINDRLQSMAKLEGADQEQIEMLKREYSRAFNDAHNEHVETPTEEVKSWLRENQKEIADERNKVTSAIGEIQKMQGTSDIGKNEASKTEKKLSESKKEYESMEQNINDKISKQEAVVRESRNKIQSLFK